MQYYEMPYQKLLRIVRRGVRNWLKAHGVEFLDGTDKHDSCLQDSAVNFLKKKGICLQILNTKSYWNYTIIGKKKIRESQMHLIQDAYEILHDEPDGYELDEAVHHVKPWLPKEDLAYLERHNANARKSKSN